MKLRTPESMTPGYWLKNRGMHIEPTNTALVQNHGIDYIFDVKEDSQGRVVIANHGRIKIRRSGDRDPDWRADMRRLCGVGCDLASEFTGQLFCPHTAKKISVSRIEGNPPLWIDYESRTACNPYGVEYSSPEAPPTLSDSNIKYSFDNPKATKAFMARLMPILREAKLRCALLELSPTFNRSRMWELIKAIHANPHIATADFGQNQNAQNQVLAWGLSVIDQFKNEIKLLCADHYTSNYLEYRE